MAQPGEESMISKPRAVKSKEAMKASVMYGRQLGPEAPIAKRPGEGRAQSSSCCAPLEKFFFGTVLAYPEQSHSSSHEPHHYEKKELEPVTPLRNFADAPDDAKQGVQMATNSAAKETPGWINQDSFAAHILPDAGDGMTRFFFGVFDGHGRFGHDVSGLIRTRLPSHLVSVPSLSNPTAAFQEAIGKTDDDVYANLAEDVEFSGSTCVCCLVDWDSRMIHTANVGDSRAILGRRNENGTWEAIQLSRDHRPEIEAEKERIEMRGGVVGPHEFNGEPSGPSRVWDSILHEKPGLACSRSIGDGAARHIGVIANPEVKSRRIEPQDKILLLCSDGVWDSMSNEQAIGILKTYLHVPFVGVKALTEQVRRAEGGVLTDDTTMIFVVLQQ